MATIGVLALQGAFDLHVKVLTSLGHATRLVRTAGDFDGLDGLVLPGGESTVQRDLLARFDLEHALRALVARGVPVLATCAGAILAAHFGFADIAVERNAWGRQIDSFEAESDRHFPLVFIRAPRIVKLGARTEVVDTYQSEPVLVREGNITCATFHPELTERSDVHEAVFGWASPSP